MAYLWKVHVDETKSLLRLPAENIFLASAIASWLAMRVPSIRRSPTAGPYLAHLTQAHDHDAGPPAGLARTVVPEDQVNDYTIISGTPKTILPKIHHVLEYIQPGSVFFWDGDGAMTRRDQMRSLQLMGEEVIPAVRRDGQRAIGELFQPLRS